MKISDTISLDFDDVLIRPQRTTIDSRSKVSLERDFYFYHSSRCWNGVPIIAANMACVASFDLANALANHKIITCLHKYYTTEELIEYFKTNTANKINYVWPTIGFSEHDLNKLESVANAINVCPNICIDVASGYMESFVKFCKKVREAFPLSIIMAGNVCTAEMTQELIIHGGVDIVKTQIGPGAACTTRMVTGVGYGTLSTCIECGHVAHGLKSDHKQLGLICSDGGCKTSGDVCKAFCAGADFVMLGNMFAGCDENLSLLKYDEVLYKYFYYGMSTHYAQSVIAKSGIKSYRASEGTTREIKPKGSVNNVVQEILGGIRSCCAMIGAHSIKDMNKCAEFVRVNKIHSNFGSANIGE